MKRKILTVFILLLGFKGFTQKKDTIFYDKYWNKSLKKDALYYRLTPPKMVNNLFEIRDYYMDGTLQMKGFSTSSNKSVFQGDVIWYYPNGSITVHKTYEHGKLTGEESSYFKDGSLMSKGVYKNGKPFEGTFYLSSTSKDKTASYENGVLKSYNTFFEANKKVAKQTLYNARGFYEHTIYFRPNGDSLSIANDFRGTSEIPKKSNKIILSFNKNNNVDRVVFVKYSVKKEDVLTETLTDVDGNLIAKGVYKNGYPENGKFFEGYRLTTYVDKYLNGETIFYDDAFDEIARGIYHKGKQRNGTFYEPNSRTIESFKDGIIVGKTTKDKFSNISYYCTIKDGLPYNGEFFTYESLEFYTNGKLTKKIQYKYNTGEKETETLYLGDGYTIAQVTYYYDNDKKSTVTYRDGTPYDGKEINNYGFITYNHGKTQGPFLIEDTKVKVLGNYTEDLKKNGSILYVLQHNKDTLRCNYIDGKPINGTVYDYGKIISYKNGKKEGCAYKTFNNRHYAYDSLKICYHSGIPVGTAQYFKKDSIVALIEYKNGKPYHGTEYKFQNKTNYANGDIVLTERVEGYKQKNIKIFKKGKLIKTVVRDYETDTLKYEAFFKNGKPYNGINIEFDSIQNVYIETSYQNSKKHGTETVYNKLYEPFITKFVYRQGMKHGPAEFRLEKWKDSIYKASYIDNQPKSGIVLERNKNYISKTIYEDGNPIKTYYLKIYSLKELAAINYKNGKPYKGMSLLYKDKKMSAKKYENGILNSTFLGVYNFAIGGDPNFRNKVYHYVLKDSAVSNSSYQDKGKNFVIRYENKKKQHGKIDFYSKDSLIGNAAFKNQTITDFNYKFTNRKKETETIMFLNNHLQYTFGSNDFKAKFISNQIRIKDEPYIFFGSILKGRINNATLKLFIDSQLVSEVTFKDNKPYDGIVFINKEKQYTLFKIEKGKRTEEYLALSKEGLLHKIEELK